MAYLFYVRLIALTAGTLVYLFLIALILGHRRPRLFERLLFFLVLALFAIYAGGLLDINARIQYVLPPRITILLSQSLIVSGTFFLLPLICHTHFEYARTIQKVAIRWWARASVWLLYLFPIGELARLALLSHRLHRGFATSIALYQNADLIRDWMLCAFVAGVAQWWLIPREKNRDARSLSRWLFAISCALFAATATWVIARDRLPATLGDSLLPMGVVAAVLPGALLIYHALRHNFLEYGAQRNLVYALSATFLALLYLALVHRVSGWLAPEFPPEATASVLLFVLIFLFEPMERVIGPALHRTMRERMDRTQRLSAELQAEARHGDLARLLSRAEELIQREFGLAAVRISIPREAAHKPLEAPGGLGHAAHIRLVKDGDEVGMLEAATTGAFLTGETSAALQFLAEQIPAMADLCQLIEEKLRLERELAERERMAMLGQMAASVSHNLRNPLSSMKTILQVQLEKRDLPGDVRHDCALVLAEINRMNAKLTQLLKFAKPATKGAERVSVAALAKETVGIFRRDAERRNVIVELDAEDAGLHVGASEEALSEVLSNLILNAIEAQPEGGRVRVSLARKGARVEICVDDGGPGISAEMRAKIFQPFFTTKATGTGLGLAIVARRVEEMSGTLACESPIDGGKGSRFRVTLPMVGMHTKEKLG